MKKILFLFTFISLAVFAVTENTGYYDNLTTNDPSKTTVDVKKNIDVQSTGGLYLPLGTTGERPTPTKAGMLRYNSTTGSAEIFDGAIWGAVGGGGGISPWASSTDYEINDVIFNNDRIYKSLDVHTSSGSFVADSAHWQELSPTDLSIATGTLSIIHGGTGKTSQLDSSDILIPNNTSSSGETLLSEEIDHIWSSGVLHGAEITDNGNGTVNIALANVIIRPSYAVTSITRSASTATVTLSGPQDIQEQERITIRGANESEYNGSFLIHVIDPSHFSYTVSGTPSTPATGTIVALDPHEDLKFLDVPAATNMALTDHQTNYIFADWNYGTPVWGVSTDPLQSVGLARITTWVVSREGNQLWKIDNRAFTVDTTNKSQQRYIKKELLTPEVGGLILSETGTRNFAVTSGVFWYGLTTQNAPAFNTSTVDTFTYAYTSDSGTTWTYSTGQTQISNTQYNAVGSGLSSITAGKYGVAWIYEMVNTPTTLMVLYGQGDYTKSEAFASQEPTIKPSIVSGGGVLIGKIIIAQGASSFTNVTSSFVKVFPNLSPTLDSLADVVVPTPTLNDVISWNGSNWVNVPNTVSTSAGAGVTFFNATPIITANSASNAVSLATLSPTPITTAEQTTSATNATSISMCTTNTPCAFAAWLSGTLGRTTIDGGKWTFDSYASISNAGGTDTVGRYVYSVIPQDGASYTVTIGSCSGTAPNRTCTATSSGGTPFATNGQVTTDDCAADVACKAFASATNVDAARLQTPTGLYRISARTSDTVVTINVPTAYTGETAVAYSVWKRLFGIDTGDINAATATLFETQSVQPAFPITTNHKLGSVTFATMDNLTHIITIYYNGTTHNTSVTTPLISLHNDLAGKQGGTSNEFYHLTATEYTGSGSGVFAKVTSPVFTTPNIGNATGNVSGTAATFTGSLTGPITSTGMTTAIASQTGTGTKFVMDATPTISNLIVSGHPTIEGVTATGATGTGKFVFDNSPTFTTPNIGVATGNSLVLGGTLDADALFDVQSTTKLSKPMPPMTTAQKVAIASGTPSEGSFAYDTTLHLPSFFDGTSWQTAMGNISSAKLEGTFDLVGNTNCSFSTTSATYVAFSSADADCGAQNVTGTITNNGKTPSFQIPVKTGYVYRITFGGPIWNNSATDVCHFAVSDYAASTTPLGMESTNYGTGTRFTHNPIVGVFKATSNTTKTFGIIAKRVSGSDTCLVHNNTTNEHVYAIVESYFDEALSIGSTANVIQSPGTTTPKIVSADIDSAAVITNDSATFLSSCTDADPSDCTMTGSFWTAAPRCWANVNTAGNIAAVNTLTPTTTTHVYIDRTDSNTAFTLFCMGH